VRALSEAVRGARREHHIARRAEGRAKPEELTPGKRRISEPLGWWKGARARVAERRAFASRPNGTRAASARAAACPAGRARRDGARTELVKGAQRANDLSAVAQHDEEPLCDGACAPNRTRNDEPSPPGRRASRAPPNGGGARERHAGKRAYCQCPRQGSPCPGRSPGSSGGARSGTAGRATMAADCVPTHMIVFSGLPGPGFRGTRGQTTGQRRPHQRSADGVRPLAPASSCRCAC